MANLLVGKKRRIKWKELIFHLHRRDISSKFEEFKSLHPRMSVNRCAYNVLKTFYSTTAMRDFKEFFEKFNLRYEDLADLRSFMIRNRPYEMY